MNTNFEEGRASAAPQLSALYVGRAIWEIDEEESGEEQHEDEDWQRLQCVVNTVCRDKWKQAMKNTAKEARNDGDSDRNSGESMSPFIPAPKVSIRECA